MASAPRDALAGDGGDGAGWRLPILAPTAMPRRTRWFRLVVLSALAACGGGGGDPAPTPPTPPAPPAVRTVTVTPALVALTAVGQTAPLTAGVEGTTGPIPSPAVTWASSAPAVATVTGSGASATVTAVAPGSAQITATSGGVTGTATVTVTLPPPPAIAITAAPISIAAGGSGSVEVVLTRTSFTGAVAVTIFGAPTGVTPVVTANGDRYAVALSVAATVAPGTYALVATATGTGVAPATASIPLTVTAPPGSLTLAASPAALSLVAGSSGTSTLTLTRTNVSGAVTFAVSGAPAGVTAVVAPSPTTTNSATLSVQVAPGTPAGPSTLTVTARADGVPPATATVALTVQSPGTGGGNTLITFCGQTPAVPIWVAAQDAGGRWQRLQPGPNNTYRFDRSGREGLAYVMSTGPGMFQTVIRYDALNELVAGCFDPAQRRRVTGTMAGLGVTDASTIVVGFGFMTPGPTAAAPAISLEIPQPGPVDLVALRTAVGPQPGVTRLTRILLQRGINPPNGGSLGVVDFGGVDAFAPESTQVTVSGEQGLEQVSLVSSFITSTSAVVTLGGASPLTSALLPRVPAGRIAGGDVHQFQASAVAQTVAGGTIRAVISQLRAPPATVALTLPAFVATPVISALPGAPYLRTRFQLPRQADFADAWSFSLGQSGRSVLVQLDAAGAGTANAIDVAVPDFTGVDGWQSAWMPVPGVQSTWQVLASSFARLDGATGRVGGRSGLITP